MTQASSAYLATALARADWQCEVTDLSGVIDYYNAVWCKYSAVLQIIAPTLINCRKLDG